MVYHDLRHLHQEWPYDSIRPTGSTRPPSKGNDSTPPRHRSSTTRPRHPHLSRRLASRLGLRKELRATCSSSAQFNSSVPPPLHFSLGKYPHDTSHGYPTVLSAEEVEEVHDQPGLHGWPNTCPPDSELRRHQDGLQDISGRRYAFAQSYIHDPVAASNFCLHPDLIQLNGFLSATQPKMHQFFPLFSFTKLQGFAELPLSPPSQFSQDAGSDPDWESKNDALFWRGSTTGTLFSRLNNWRRSQRTRLVMCKTFLLNPLHKRG